MVVGMETNRNRFTTFDQEVSGQVRAEMAYANTTQRQVAQQIGMHETVLGRKCRGVVPFTAGELSRVASALGTTAEDILALAERRVARAGHAERAEDHAA